MKQLAILRPVSRSDASGGFFREVRLHQVVVSRPVLRRARGKTDFHAVVFGDRLGNDPT
jgi:hypothetical protein